MLRRPLSTIANGISRSTAKAAHNSSVTPRHLLLTRSSTKSTSCALEAHLHVPLASGLAKKNKASNRISHAG